MYPEPYKQFAPIWPFSGCNRSAPIWLNKGSWISRCRRDWPPFWFGCSWQVLFGVLRDGGFDVNIPSWAKMIRIVPNPYVFFWLFIFHLAYALFCCMHGWFANFERRDGTIFIQAKPTVDPIPVSRGVSWDYSVWVGYSFPSFCCVIILDTICIRHSLYCYPWSPYYWPPPLPWWEKSSSLVHSPPSNFQNPKKRVYSII